MAKSLVTLLTPLGARYYNRRGKQPTYKRCVLSIEHVLKDARITFYFFARFFLSRFRFTYILLLSFRFSCFSRNRVLSFFDVSRSYSCRFLLTAARFSVLSLFLCGPVPPFSLVLYLYYVLVYTHSMSIPMGGRLKTLPRMTKKDAQNLAGRFSLE